MKLAISPNPNRHIIIHTDGSCLGNPGPGGYAAIMHLMDGDTLIRTKRIVGHEQDTTNNRMEMLAAIMALEAVTSDKPVTLRSDSQLLIKGITEWIEGWKARSWKGSNGRPVQNVDLWKRLDELNSTRNVTWEWVRGHNNDPLNELADNLANAQAHKAEAARRAASSPSCIVLA